MAGTRAAVAPSKRFLRAAASERRALLKQHARLTAERDRYLALADTAGTQAAEIGAQLRALAVAVGDPSFVDTTAPGLACVTQPRDDCQADRVARAGQLRGPAVRMTAVRVLLAQPGHVEAVHYRDWYDMVVAAGYAIGGKDPRAVFLTQITRSPVVVGSTERGVWGVDRQAPLRLRRDLDRLVAELSHIEAGAPGVGNAARRRRLTTDINRVERQLAEALDVLNPSIPEQAAQVA